MGSWFARRRLREEVLQDNHHDRCASRGGDVRFSGDVRSAATVALPDQGSSALPPAPRMREHLALASSDFVRGLLDWRLWLLLGSNDIRQRYRRSRIGQFWITLSMVVTIGALGVVYSFLFRMPLGEYLPFLAMGIIGWGLISSIVNDACIVFTAAENYIRQVPIAKSVFVHRMLARNLVIFGHNVALVPFLYLLFGIPFGWAILLAPLGIALVALNGVWIGLFLGTLCTRFRDLPQIAASVVQIAFFVTPVMWKPAQLPPGMAWAVNGNPFAALLAVVRDPLLGVAPSWSDYALTIGVMLVGLAVTVPFFARFRARIVYWL